MPPYQCTYSVAFVSQSKKLSQHQMELLYSSISGEVQGICAHERNRDDCTVLVHQRDACKMFRYEAATPYPCLCCPAGPPSLARSASLLSKQGEHLGTFLHAQHLHRGNIKHSLRACHAMETQYHVSKEVKLQRLTIADRKSSFHQTMTSQSC